MYKRAGKGKKPGRSFQEEKSKKAKWKLTAGLWLLISICTVSGLMVKSVLAAPEDPEVEKAAEAMLRQQEQQSSKQEPEIQEQEEKEEPENKEPLIIIDPGHGGLDDGCVSAGVSEKDINLEIAKLVSAQLEEKGYRVELSRDTDTYIAKEDRVENANLNNAAVYISIHQNSCEDKDISGIETWYDGADTSRDSKRLAQLIHQQTIQSTGASEREMVGESDLYVTGKTKMPSCLIETGFLSNGEERGRLVTEEYRQKIADGIVSGIELYFKPRTMYLTFDDGPSAQNTDLILDTLKQRNIKATFFVIGEYVRKYPETAKRIVQEGHTIGIHCDVHDYDILYDSVDSYIEDFEKAYKTVYEVTGVEAKLFRFPGGSVNAYNKKVCQEIVEEMEKRGFIYFDWNASLEDAAGSKKEPDELIQCAKETTLGRKKVVLLAHDRVEGTALCLNDLIDALPEYEMKPLTPYIEPVQFRRFWEKEEK